MPYLAPTGEQWGFECCVLLSPLTPHLWAGVPRVGPQAVYSCSYDSSLRRGDLNKEVFGEVRALYGQILLYRCFIKLCRDILIKINRSVGLGKGFEKFNFQMTFCLNPEGLECLYLVYKLNFKGGEITTLLYFCNNVVWVIF